MFGNGDMDNEGIKARGKERENEQKMGWEKEEMKKRRNSVQGFMPLRCFRKEKKQSFILSVRLGIYKLVFFQILYRVCDVAEAVVRIRRPCVW